jgi:hypothetical protein
VNTSGMLTGEPDSITDAEILSTSNEASMSYGFLWAPPGNDFDMALRPQCPTLTPHLTSPTMQGHKNRSIVPG